MEESHPQTERRCEPRFAVDVEATLVVVRHDAIIRGRILELSLDGCRVRADRPCSVATPAGIEVTFKIKGTPFRLAGMMRWVDSHRVAGIEFGSMAPRRHEALVDLFAELEAEERTRTPQGAAQEAAPPVENSVALSSSQGDQESRRNGGVQFSRAHAGPASGPTLLPAVPKAAPVAAVRHEPTPVPIASQPAAQASGAAPNRRERRAQTRHAIETGATIFFIDVRAEIAGRILDLSMSGCRIRADERFPVGIYRRVETEFKLDGLPFRLGGVVQSLHDRFTVGIRFLDLSSRKREQLAQLMEELEEMRNEESGKEG